MLANRCKKLDTIVKHCKKLPKFHSNVNGSFLNWVITVKKFAFVGNDAKPSQALRISKCEFCEDDNDVEVG